MTREKIDYTHGDTGKKPTPLDFNSNERPDAQEFDWWWYNVTRLLKAHAGEFDRLDSNDDGVVDKADGAGSVSVNGLKKVDHPTDIDFTGPVNVTDDGDGTASVSISEYTDSKARDAVTGNVDLANLIGEGDPDQVLITDGYNVTWQYPKIPVRNSDPSSPDDGEMWLIPE
jgi:hypothetical protein